MSDFLEKLDFKTVVAIILFIGMGLALGEKYASKHLLKEGTVIKNIFLESTEGKRTPIVSKNQKKYTILYAFSRDCVLCGFQKAMLTFTLGFLDESKWKFVPIAFDFKNRDLVRSYKKREFKRYDIYFGNSEIKSILNIKQFPSLYFISSTGHISSRTAIPNTVIGLLWKAYQTEDVNSDDRPLLHRL
jgi:hypothetical protein